MGELTTCNFCSLRKLQRGAKETKQKVVILDSFSSLGGLDVYVCPASVKIPLGHKHETDRVSSFDAYWCCWFMELSKECCC